ALGAQDQARQVEAATGTASEMAEAVEQVAGNANSVASASVQTRSTAEEGGRAVNATTQAMSDIRDVVSQAADRVRELGALGEKIGAVVETIDDIAGQTNLLAL